MRRGAQASAGLERGNNDRAKSSRVGQDREPALGKRQQEQVYSLQPETFWPPVPDRRPTQTAKQHRPPAHWTGGLYCFSYQRPRCTP